MADFETAKSFGLRYSATDGYYNAMYEKDYDQQEVLQPLYEKFADIDSSKGFRITYEIVVGNLPRPIKGLVEGEDRTLTGTNTIAQNLTIKMCR